MSGQRQVFNDVLNTLQQPDNLAQAIIVVLALMAGWWAAKFARTRITVAPDPDNLPDRMRELLYIGAPQAVTLVVLAAVDGLMHVRADTTG